MTFAAERHAIDERANVITEMAPYFEKLQRGERLSVEDQKAFDERNHKVTDLDGEIRTYREARERSAAEAPAAPTETPSGNAAEAREKAFSTYIRSGVVSPELRTGAPQETAVGGQGGYLVPPGWWQRLQVALKAFGGTAEDFTQIETESGQPMQWATNNPTATVGTLLGESTQVQEVDYTFGQGTIGAYMYTSGVQLVSLQLANDSAFDVDAFLSQRVGESLGRALAAAAISGTGSAQPLGIVTALAATASTGTVGSAGIAANGGFLTLGTSATAGAIKVGGNATTELVQNTIGPQTIVSMIASVDPAYRDLGAKWYFNDQHLLGLRAQTDANGRPLINMQDGLTQGSPGSLYGYPIKVDNNLPNLAIGTTGGPIFGHLPTAMVKRTVNQSGLLRLTERYADFLQVGFIGYMRFDIRSNDLRAAVTVKGAAS